MGDLRSFQLDMTKFADLQPKVISEVVRSAALKVFRGVIQGSPVDTGRFRASWFIGVRFPNRAVSPERAKQTGAKSASSGESLARLAELTPETVTGKDPIILSNNLPYAMRLATGWSGQAPNGWIDAVLTRVNAELTAAGKKRGIIS